MSKEATRVWKKKKMEANPSLCMTCLKRPSIPGMKVCQVCRDRQAKRYRELKKIVFNHYGNECACCGENNPSFLTIDHINNDGYKWKQPCGQRPSSDRLYLWLINNNFPDGFQLLCMNCNWGKARNNGVCPHKIEKEEELLNG